MMKVDVVLVTKNSNSCYFKYVLDSLYRNVDVNRLIVVDGGSTDGTIEVLKRYPRVEIIYDTEGTRATAREIGIKCVETEWFLFLDSDVVLCKSWQRIAEKYIRDDVGAIQGYDVPVRSPEVEDYYYAITKLRRLFRREENILSWRGFTGDVLIRTELVKDLKIPKYLHVFEDYYIKRHIERKGFKWVIPRDLYCYHLMGERLSRVKEDGYLVGYFSCVFNRYSTMEVLKALITIFPKTVFAFCVRPNTRMLRYQVLRQVYFTVGFMRRYFMDRGCDESLL